MLICIVPIISLIACLRMLLTAVFRMMVLPSVQKPSASGFPLDHTALSTAGGGGTHRHASLWQASHQDEFIASTGWNTLAKTSNLIARPQIKLVWFNFRFGAIQQPYITADIFHYPAKAGGGWGQGCRSPQEDIIALLWHTFSRSHSLPPSYNRAIYNTQTHRAVTAHARERVRYIQIIVIVPVRSVRDDVNSIIATVSEGECVCACVCETNVRLLLHANRRVTQNSTSRSVCLWELLFVSLVITRTWRISALFFLFEFYLNIFFFDNDN